MDNTNLTERQAISIIILFLCGSSLLFGIAAEAQADIWLAIIIGIIMGLIVSCIYARILIIFPNKNLYDIANIVFGKYVGKIFIALYTLYTFYLATLVVNDYGNFTNIIGLESTPRIIILTIFVSVVILGVKLGIKVIGRWSELVVILLFVFVFFTFILDIPSVEPNNLKPVLAKGIKPILTSAYKTFCFPLAESVVLLFIFDKLDKKTSKYKVYTTGILLAGLIIFITGVMSLLVLGKYGYSTEYFTLYAAASRISISSLIQRIEILIAVSILMAGFVETAICMIATSKGVSYIFNCKDYKFISVPLGILLVISAFTSFDSIMDVIDFNKYIIILYSPFFQIVLPIIIWIGAELKNKSKKHKNIDLQNE